MADIDDDNIEISSRNRNRTTLEKNNRDEDQEELSAKVRNVLLVVVTLVASVTFSAGINPPGGVCQETTAGNCTCTPANGTNTANGTDHTAGEAILASKPVPYSMFLVANTVAFSTSAFVISTLVSVYPFKTEIWIAMFAMSFTYGAAISAVTPAYIKFRYVFPAFAAPLLIVAFTWLRKKSPPAVYNYMRRRSSSSS